MLRLLFPLLMVLLLLSGCQQDHAVSSTAGTPTAPNALPTGVSVDELLNTGEVAIGPEVELLPESYVAPDMPSADAEVRAGASTYQGSFSLAGASVTGAGLEASPKTLGFPVNPGDLIRVHLRGSFRAGGTGSFTAKLIVPGYSTIVTIDADDAWDYHAIYMPGFGQVQVSLYNGAVFEGGLNDDALDFDYFVDNLATPDSDEPNADNQPATVTDYTMANVVAPNTSTTRSLYFQAPVAQDTEEWYRFNKDTASTELLITLDTHADRYSRWLWRVAFYEPATLQQIGLPWLIRPPFNQRTFRLTKLPVTDHILMRIYATPLPIPIDSNVAHASYTLQVEEPLRVIDAKMTGNTLIAYPRSATNWTASVTGAPSAGAIWHWDFGEGATCNSTCDTFISNVTTADQGSYTTRVWVADGPRISNVFEQQYTVRCLKEPDLSSATFEYKRWNYGGESRLVRIGEAPASVHRDNIGRLAVQLGQATAQAITTETFSASTRLEPLVHQGRLFIAFRNTTTRYLEMMVSHDLAPTGPESWTRYLVDERPTQNLTMGFAAVDGYPGIVYRTGTALFPEMRLAYAKKQLPVRQLDWGTGIVTTEITSDPIELAGKDGRWWIINTDSSPDEVRVYYSGGRAPYNESHWGSYQLLSAPTGPRSIVNLGLAEAEDRFAVMVSESEIATSTTHAFTLLRATAPSPLKKTDWTATPVSFQTAPKFATFAFSATPTSFWLMYPASNSWYLLRSCDFNPVVTSDWARSKLDSVSSSSTPDGPFFGVIGPISSSYYLHYGDRNTASETPANVIKTAAHTLW